MNPDNTFEHEDEAVQYALNLCAKEISELRNYVNAPDIYEAGGHWIAETYDDEDLARVLIDADGNVDNAKEALRHEWTHMNMLEREHAYGDE